MLEIRIGMGNEYTVHLNGEQVGTISPVHGFYQDPTSFRIFSAFSSGDLRTIANKVDDVQGVYREHEVEIDYAGSDENRPRLTCRSPGCSEATLVYQPHMKNEKWNKEFMEKHPCKNIRKS